MKTHFYILLMLGMVFLLGCEDEKLRHRPRSNQCSASGYFGRIPGHRDYHSGKWLYRL